jgi:polar amino acid transport system substrate-binding protein
MGRRQDARHLTPALSPQQSTGVVVVVPKGHAAAREWAAHFLADAKADGTVRRALDSGSTNAKVAP